MVKSKQSKKILGFLLIGVVFVVFVGLGVFFALSRVEEPQIPEIVDDTQEAEVVTTSVEVPEENIPEEFYVAPEDPKKIIIPSIGVEALIQLVGRDQNGNIAVPNNIHLAGWYVNSVRPGERGLSIIDGHKDGITAIGVFYNLDKVASDDVVIVEFGDGSKKEFKVIEIKQVPISDAFTAMYTRYKEYDSQVNLVSCAGSYNQSIKTYDDRIVVVAVMR